MQVRTSRTKVLSTPGFARQGLAADKALAIVGYLTKAGVGNEPSWVVGDPAVILNTLEDRGRTLKLKAQFRFYAIRDDHDGECLCGCDGASMVVTFLLPEEY